MKTVYLETSIPSYLTARPSRDIQAVAWQQLTDQWWDEERGKYQLFVSELVLVEASAGDAEAAKRRLEAIAGVSELSISEESENLATNLIEKGGVPEQSEADALHIAIASVNNIDYIMTWNCRHINNAEMKPKIRNICKVSGYVCPEICTPLELLSEGED